MGRAERCGSWGAESGPENWGSQWHRGQQQRDPALQVPVSPWAELLLDLCCRVSRQGPCQHCSSASPGWFSSLSLGFGTHLKRYLVDKDGRELRVLMASEPPNAFCVTSVLIKPCEVRRTLQQKGTPAESARWVCWTPGFWFLASYSDNYLLRAREAGFAEKPGPVPGLPWRRHYATPRPGAEGSLHTLHILRLPTWAPGPSSPLRFYALASHLEAPPRRPHRSGSSQGPGTLPHYWQDAQKGTQPPSYS